MASAANDLAQYLDPSAVVLDMKAATRNEAFSELSEAIFRKNPQVNRDDLLKLLLEREKDGTTAIGEGVAIPHARLKGLSQVVLAFGRSQSGIPCEAGDDKLVRLFFVLLVPERKSILKYLAQLSQICLKPEVRMDLLAASKPEDITGLLRRTAA
jgi:PTS system nitrogen regulatory IIA component